MGLITKLLRRDAKPTKLQGNNVKSIVTLEVAGPDIETKQYKLFVDDTFSFIIRFQNCDEDKCETRTYSAKVVSVD